MSGKISIDDLVSSGKFEYYKRLFEKINQERSETGAGLPGIPIHETRDAFLKASVDSKQGHIFFVQTQGYLPTSYDGKVASGPDTGGQTFYVLNTAKAMAKLGYKVTILGQRFGTEGPYLRWLETPNGGLVEIVRLIPGGLQLDASGHTVVSQTLLPKEELYWKLRGMAEDAAVVGMLRGAYGFIGGYADGSIISVAAAQALETSAITILHSMGQKKLINAGMDPKDPFTYFGTSLNLGARKQAEIASVLGASKVVANAPDEADAYKALYGVNDPGSEFYPPGVHRAFFTSNLLEGYKDEHLRARELMEQNKLEEGKFFMNWGRIASSKNIAGQVILLGELRDQFPDVYNNFKLVIVGGDPDRVPLDPGEAEEMAKIKAAADLYKLRFGPNGQIVRIKSQDAPVIASMYLNAFAHLGTQNYEQFGMAVAEASAVDGRAFVAITQAAGFTSWAHKKGYGEDFVTLDLGFQTGSKHIDKSKYAAAARLIHDFSQRKDLRQKIERLADLASRELRWKSLGEHLVQEISEAKILDGKRIEPQDVSYAASPFWNEEQGRTLQNQTLVNESRQVGEVLTGWLKSLKGEARKLITVAGQQAELFADLIWSAISQPDLPVQRVSRKALDGVPADKLMEVVRTGLVDSKYEAGSSATSDGNKKIGGIIKSERIIQDHTKAVIAEVRAKDALVGDIHIVIGSNPTPERMADIFVGSAYYMVNAEHLKQFVK